MAWWAVVLVVLVAGCDAGFESRIRVSVSPQALTLPSGGSAPLTIDVSCSHPTQFFLSFLPPEQLSGVTITGLPDSPTCVGPDAASEASARLDVTLTAAPGVAVARRELQVYVEDASETDSAFANLTVDIVDSSSPSNLLVNPSFEQGVLVGQFPSVAGQWGGDQTEVTAATQGIAPHQGAAFLRFEHTGLTVGPTFSSQIWQIVDVRSLVRAAPADSVFVDASAWFNRISGDATTDRRFDLRILAFDVEPAEIAAGYTATTYVGIAGASVDTVGETWQQASATLGLPAQTTYVVLELYAYEDVTNDTSGTEFAGHFVDDAVLTARTVP